MAILRKNANPSPTCDSSAAEDSMSQVCNLFVLKDEALATLDNSDYDLQLAKGQIVLVLNGHNTNKMVYVALVSILLAS